MATPPQSGNTGLQRASASEKGHTLWRALSVAMGLMLTPKHSKDIICQSLNIFADSFASNLTDIGDVYAGKIGFVFYW